jgi:hypothetical protein
MDNKAPDTDRNLALVPTREQTVDFWRSHSRRPDIRRRVVSAPRPLLTRRLGRICYACLPVVVGLDLRNEQPKH